MLVAGVGMDCNFLWVGIGASELFLDAKIVNGNEVKGQTRDGTLGHQDAQPKQRIQTNN